MSQAALDCSLNNNFSSSQYGAPGRMVAPQVSFIARILEPGFNAYSAYHLMHPTSVYAAPAVIPTAAVGKNPWDTTFGPIGVDASHGAIPTAAPLLPSQAGTTSFA